MVQRMQNPIPKDHSLEWNGFHAQSLRFTPRGRSAQGRLRLLYKNSESGARTGAPHRFKDGSSREGAQISNNANKLLDNENEPRLKATSNMCAKRDQHQIHGGSHSGSLACALPRHVFIACRSAGLLLPAARHQNRRKKGAVDVWINQRKMEGKPRLCINGALKGMAD